MLYAIVNNIKSTANETGLRGICPLCNSEVYSKCGEKRIWHWAHLKKDCDEWHETETEWHRLWKSYFPVNNIEVVVKRGDRLHRADTLTDSGICVEFQNSPISAKVVAEREEFYRKIIWVVNAEKFKDGLSYSLFKEIELCNDYLPEYIEEYKPIGFKKFPAFIYDNNSEFFTNEIIAKFEFVKEAYTGKYYLSLLGLSDFEVLNLRQKMIEYLKDKGVVNYKVSEVEEISMMWNKIPNSWNEALGPILFDIGNDMLIYINGSDKICNGIGLIKKEKFLINPDFFVTSEVEECYSEEPF